MTQPTALFLADILEDGGKPADIAEKAAAELRRLHAELERCKQVCAATSESWQTDAEKWGFQRDALLKALKEISAMWDHHCYAHGDGQPTPLHIKARAAITKAEGERK